MQSRDVVQIDAEIRRAASGPDEDYAVVLERALAMCATDPTIADDLDELELHSELADVYDRMGRVAEALDQVDVLASSAAIGALPIHDAAGPRFSCGTVERTRRTRSGPRYCASGQRTSGFSTTPVWSTARSGNTKSRWTG